MELYAAMVEHMDANIGKLTSYLKEKNLYNNTLIIFLSDNGPEGNEMKMGAPWDNSKFEDWGKKGTFIQYGPAWAQAGAVPIACSRAFCRKGAFAHHSSFQARLLREVDASLMRSRTSWMSPRRS